MRRHKIIHMYGMPYYTYGSTANILVLSLFTIYAGASVASRASPAKSGVPIHNLAFASVGMRRGRRV